LLFDLFFQGGKFGVVGMCRCGDGCGGGHCA
jgi:hypothetical protein